MEKYTGRYGWKDENNWYFFPGELVSYFKVYRWWMGDSPNLLKDWVKSLTPEERSKIKSPDDFFPVVLNEGEIPS